MENNFKWFLFDVFQLASDSLTYPKVEGDEANKFLLSQASDVSSKDSDVSAEVNPGLY